MLRNILKKVWNSIMFLPREIHYGQMRKKLTNHNFSIIASDCFGSFAYHNLKERFNSPTINLFISTDDFICFVKNLREYLASELKEIKDDTKQYPVGEITYSGKAVRIDFMHYHSFEEAKEKWNERKQRVNYANIFIVQTIAGELKREMVDAFSALPYKNKLLITRENDFGCDCNVTHPIFSKANYKPGEFLKFKTIFSCKRHMDDIDYVEFFNGRNS